MRNNIQLHFAVYIGITLAFLPAFSEAEDDIVRSLRTVLQHIPGVSKIVSIDLTSDVGGQLAAAASDVNNQVFVVVRNGTNWRVLRPSEDLKSQASVVFYDLDGDGNPELVVGSDRVRVYSVRPRQLDLLWESDSLFGFDTPAPRVGFGDCNNDGARDMVVVNYKNRIKGVDQEPNQQSVYLFEHQPKTDHRFELRSTLLLTDQHGFHSTAGLAVADFIADEGAEIAVGNDNGFLWLVALRGNELEVVRSWQVPKGGAVGTGMCAANVDLDAKAELFIGTNGGSVFAYDFVEDSVELIASVESGRLAYGVAAADFDSDGIDELVLSRGNLGYARMTEKDVVLEVYGIAGEVLERKWSHQTTDHPRNLVIDIDHDGQLEIVVFSLLGDSSTINILRPELGID